MQDNVAQRVSHAAASLQEKVIGLCDERPIKVLEAGFGSGIISIMLALQRPAWQITGIEIQPQLVELARQNAAGVGLTLDFLQADLRDYDTRQAFDLIVSNPPWRKSGTGLPNLQPALQLSRDDATCAPDDLAAFIRRNLKPDGRAVLIYHRQRQHDLEAACEKSLLDIIAACPTSGTDKYLIFSIKHKGQNP